MNDVPVACSRNASDLSGRISASSEEGIAAVPGMFGALA